jgi:HlyD family secretion protein
MVYLYTGIKGGKFMKIYIIKLLGLITAVSILLSGCASIGSGKNDDIYTGTIEADSYFITSEVSGKVLELQAVQGSNIKKGDKICRVDSRMYEIQKSGAEGALSIAQSKLDSIPSSTGDDVIKQAKGAVKQAQSAVDLLQAQIDKCNIVSDNEGMITDIYTHIGELVSPGMNIARLSSTKDKYVKVYIEESRRDKVKVGDNLDLNYNGKKLTTGHIIYISPESEFTPKNIETKSEKEKTVFEVKIAVDEPDRAAAGMLVDVTLK